MNRDRRSRRWKGDTSKLQRLKSFGGLTFFKDLTNESINADYSVGSPLGTFTRTACNATYTDKNGVLQLSSSANVRRKQEGYYDTTGFHIQSGTIFESSAGSGLDNMIIRTDGTANGSGAWTGWSTYETVAGSYTLSVVDITSSLLNVASATSQRVQYTGEAGDTAAVLYRISTVSGAATVVNGEKVAYSVYLRAQTTNTAVINIQITFNDANQALVNYSTVYDVTSLVNALGGSWGRFINIGTAADKTATISAYADLGGGQVRVTTSSAHGFPTGALITISGSTNYNASYTIANASGSVFDITHAWAGDDAAGTATQAIDRAKVNVFANSIDNGDVVDFEFACPQLEKRPYATSYVQTAASATTRNLDVLSFASAGNRTSAQETIVIKYAPCSVFANDAINRFVFDDDGADRVVIRKLTTGTVPTFFPNFIGSSTSSSAPTTVLAANTSYVQATVAYGASAGTNSLTYINGSVEGTANTTDYLAPTIGNFIIGGPKAATTTTSALNGIVKAVAIFSDSKSAKQIAAITNILNS